MEVVSTPDQRVMNGSTSAVTSLQSVNLFDSIPVHSRPLTSLVPNPAVPPHLWQVYRDKCFPIDGTDLEDRDCVIFDCEDTEGQCPPQEYPMCDG